MGFRRLIPFVFVPVLFACGGSETGTGVAVEPKALELSSPELSSPELSSLSEKAAADTSALQQLGKQVFFDKISNPPRQACVTCHEPDMGWTGRIPAINKNGIAIPGANPHTIGGRKPPSNAYASFSPPFACGGGGPFAPPCTGGNFWDGRAEGRGQNGPLPGFTPPTPSIGTEVFAGLDASVSNSFSGFLGPIADQALGPFGNNVEQNVPTNPNDQELDGATAVCEHVKTAKYKDLYTKAYGGTTIDCTAANVKTSFKRVALAISAWQHSSEVNQFSSKRDKCARDGSGNIIFPCATLTVQENLGHDIFYGLNLTKDPANPSVALNRTVTPAFPPGAPPAPLNANCAICHNSEGGGSTGNEPRQLYTDHAYHNIGLPSNYQIANFNANDPDAGLGERNPAHDGLVKTPTLRNVDKRRGNVAKAYMHNGYFKNLEDIVHFYNTAAEPSKQNAGSCPAGTTAAQARQRNCWPAQAFANGSARGAVLGRLGLTPNEEAAIVAYMKTFTDTNSVKKP